VVRYLFFALENCHSCWHSCHEQGISGVGVTTGARHASDCGGGAVMSKAPSVAQLR